MAEQSSADILEENSEVPMLFEADLLQPNIEEPEQAHGAAAEEPEDDMGELDFTYDDSLLQGDEEEDTAVTALQQKEQEDQEIERRKKEHERNWGSATPNALPAHKSDMPAHSRHSNIDLADRQRGYQRSQRPVQSSRGREPIRGHSNFSQSREGMQDQSRRADGPRGASLPPAASVRRQPPANPAVGHQHPRPTPAGPHQQGQPEFDPSLLYSMFNAPSFAPVQDDVSQHKRKHDQMQASETPMIHLPGLGMTSPELMRTVQQMPQQPQVQQQQPPLHQMRPNGRFSGMHMPQHNMMGPAVPPPRPPQGPPPAGPTPHIPHSAAIFAGAPNFSPMTSKAMESRPQSGHLQEGQGTRPQQGPPGWSLSHGMEGPDRAGSRQEPMLAAGMVWDTDANQASSSGREAGGARSEPFRNAPAGPRNGMQAAGPYAAGPRAPGPRPPPPVQNKAPDPAKSQAALAAAKARFEQQQKENEEIAERTKRQRMGLSAEPKPAYQETEIDRLKRQIAEKEAAVKSGQAQPATVTKSAPPSPAKGRLQSVSPSPSAPGGSTPASTSGSAHKSHRIQSSIVRPDSADPTVPLDRLRPSAERQSRTTRGSRERGARDDETDGHARHNGSASSHRHNSERRGASRDSSREKSRDGGHRDRQEQVPAQPHCTGW